MTAAMPLTAAAQLKMPALEMRRALPKERRDTTIRPVAAGPDVRYFTIDTVRNADGSLRNRRFLGLSADGKRIEVCEDYNYLVHYFTEDGKFLLAHPSLTVVSADTLSGDVSFRKGAKRLDINTSDANFRQRLTAFAAAPQGYERQTFSFALEEPDAGADAYPYSFTWGAELPVAPKRREAVIQWLKDILLKSAAYITAYGESTTYFDGMPADFRDMVRLIGENAVGANPNLRQRKALRNAPVGSAYIYTCDIDLAHATPNYLTYAFTVNNQTPADESFSSCETYGTLDLKTGKSIDPATVFRNDAPSQKLLKDAFLEAIMTELYGDEPASEAETVVRREKVMSRLASAHPDAQHPYGWKYTDPAFRFLQIPQIKRVAILPEGIAVTFDSADLANEDEGSERAVLLPDARIRPALSPRLPRR